MFKVDAWNIRELNDPLKQVEIGRLTKDNKLSILGILETHVQINNNNNNNIVSIRNKVQVGWHFLDNYMI